MSRTHGKRSTYSNGCRCELCSESARGYRQQLKDNRLRPDRSALTSGACTVCDLPCEVRWAFKHIGCLTREERLEAMEPTLRALMGK